MKNNIKIALRSFKNNKFYSSINLSGLVVGMAACFLLLMYLQYEMGYDQFHEEGDRIYQVNLSVNFGGDAFNTSNTPPPVGEAMQNEIPEVESFTRHFMPGDLVLRHKDRFYTENNIWAVDSNFLEFFTFPILEGDIKTSLKNKNAIVLTETMAKKYFDEDSPINQELFIDDTPFTVTGVIADLPSQSSLQFDALYPITAVQRVNYFSWSWVWLQLDTHVKLKQVLNKTELATLAKKYPPMIRQHAAKAFKRIGQDIDELFSNGNYWEINLKPIANTHLFSENQSSRVANLGSYTEVKVFGLVAILILLLACINFMNLSTARSLKRAKEVGVRKVLGSGRGELIRQFMSEAIIYSLVAGLLALAAVQLSLPWFNQLVDAELQLSNLFSGWTFPAFIGITLLTGILAGSYPAFYLSAFRPIVALRNNMANRKDSHGWIRNSLVVFQFAISVGLITATFIILQQIKFTQNAEIGIAKENILVLPNVQNLGEQVKTYKEELLKLPEVLNASHSTDLPTKGVFGDFYVPETDGKSDESTPDISLYSYMVDEDFVETMNIKILQGRDFDEQYGTDNRSVILNEAAIKYIGWENPIGQYIRYPGNRNQRFKVVGVMKDFHANSFHSLIEPFALFHESSKTYQLNHEFLALNIQAGSEAKVIEQSKQILSNLNPSLPFSFSFLNEDYNRLYQLENQLGSMLSVFTFLSIFIACLGLLGLIAYTIEQRTKEIGIRKVLGASVTGIVSLLAKDYLKLVGIAFLIAAPFSWYFMNDWLNDFAYRIELEWWMFVVAGLAAVVIAFATIGVQSMKAALRNPVAAIKSE